MKSFQKVSLIHASLRYSERHLAEVCVFQSSPLGHASQFARSWRQVWLTLRGGAPNAEPRRLGRRARSGS